MLNVLNIGKLKAKDLQSPTLSIHSRAVTEKSPTQKSAVVSTRPLTGTFPTTRAPVTFSLLQNTPTVKKEQGDSVDKLIETSLEKNKNRGHSDGDEETTESASEKDGDQDSPTGTNNGEINLSNQDGLDGQEKPTKNTDDEEENLELCPAKPPSLSK